MKKLLTLTLVFLTSLVFSQTILTFSPTSNTVVNSNSTVISGLGGNYNFYSNPVSLTSSTNFTVSFDYTFATVTNMLVDYGNSVNTFTLNGTGTYTTVVNKTSLNQVGFNFNYTSLWTISNLKVTYVIATGIKNVEVDNLPLDMYTNLNTLFIKNHDNVDGVKLEVFNLAGQLVYEENTVDKNSYELNVSTGIYIVRLSKEDNFKTKKVFIGQ